MEEINKEDHSWRDWYNEALKGVVVHSWNYEQFKIECNKCNSKDVFVETQDKSMAQGSEYTGMYTSCDGYTLVKCKGCGHAMIIEGL